MAPDMNRRKFLRGGLAVAAGAAAATLPLPQAVAANETAGTLCTLLDLSKCIGCEACVDACRETWQKTVPDPVQPIPDMFPARVPVADWSKRKDVQDRLTPYNWLYVEQLEFKYKGKDIELNVPRRCMHCINPPCTNLCPFGAGRVQSNGIVRIDPDICLGGAKCKTVCPWSIPQRQSGVGIYLDILPSYAGNGVMFKCNRCYSLVEKGKMPRCIEVCPEKVQKIGPRKQIVAEALKLAKEKNLHVYGLTENGGTNTIYLSPVPFDEVNRQIAASREQKRAESGGGKGKGRGLAKGQSKGKGLRAKRRKGNLGRPHMGPVDNAMAKEENMSLALVLAPVAGIAAGFTKLFAKKLPDGKGKGEQS